MEKDKAGQQNNSISTAFTGVLAVAAITLIILLAGLGYWFFVESSSTEWSVIRSILIVCGIIWTVLACLIMLTFLAVQLWVINRVKQSSLPQKRAVKQASTPQTSTTSLKKHLRARYHLLWRYKVRLLLVVGDDAARAALIPDLQEQQWLEGQRTVLIDGGSLSAAPDDEKLAALRQLRRGRPLDGIVWVLADGQLMTPQMQDNGLRSL